MANTNGRVFGIDGRVFEAGGLTECFNAWLSRREGVDGKIGENGERGLRGIWLGQGSSGCKRRGVGVEELGWFVRWEAG